ncbi:MAG TPA: serine hydrolase, partial [Burkholderiaceae bacterium]|nr:serine hydrolase [Burkholderiaceae bacterium]
MLGAAAGSVIAVMLALAAQGAHAATGSNGKGAGKPSTKAVSKNTRKAKPATVLRKAAVMAAPVNPTFGQMYGLHAVDDPLDLKSSVALVMDQDTNEILLSKNTQAVLPIASITKLMTALVVVEAGQSLDEKITVTDEDRDTEKGTGSRLTPGTTLTRSEMLHLALMSSENRAANALGRNYPGGLTAFVAAMNQKAQALGMTDTHYVEP